MPIIVVTTLGNKSGKIRKTPLMRVEHDGEYALVASQGGAPTHPVWYYNLIADPDAVELQDGPEPFAVTVHEVTGTRGRRGGSAPWPPTRPTTSTRPRPSGSIPLLVATPKAA